MRGVCVSLSSGDSFYVAASLDEVAELLDSTGLVRVGGRMVNGSQVAQLTFEREISTIHIPEVLTEEEAFDGASVG